MSPGSLSAGLVEELRTGLLDFLERPVTVAPPVPLSGGASANMWAVDVIDGRGAPHAFVVRCPGVGEAGMSIGAAAEARVMRLAAAAGVPVPAVPAVLVGRTDDAGEPVADGYVMERLQGETLPRRLLRDERFAVARGRLVGDAAKALAAIHAVPVADAGLPLLSAADQLDLLEGLHRSLGRDLGQTVPTFELVLRWLRSRTSVCEPGAETGSEPALVHGDFRTGNLLVDEGGLVAVLDWELAHVGDPLEDLGWFCAPAWRFGGPGAAGGFGTREELYDAYALASGRPVDRERARYWEVLATLKWGVICQFQASRHLGGAGSVEHAAIGRRVTEVDLDLLLLLEGAG